MFQEFVADILFAECTTLKRPFHGTLSDLTLCTAREESAARSASVAICNVMDLDRHPVLFGANLSNLSSHRQLLGFVLL